MAEQLWKIEDVAKFFAVEPSIVKYWLRTTTIPYVKIGKQIRFDPPDIRRWVEQCKDRSIHFGRSSPLERVK